MTRLQKAYADRAEDVRSEDSMRVFAEWLHSLSGFGHYTGNAHRRITVRHAPEDGEGEEGV